MVVNVYFCKANLGSLIGAMKRAAIIIIIITNTHSVNVIVIHSIVFSIANKTYLHKQYVTVASSPFQLLCDK